MIRFEGGRYGRAVYIGALLIKFGREIDQNGWHVLFSWKRRRLVPLVQAEQD